MTPTRSTVPGPLALVVAVLGAVPFALPLASMSACSKTPDSDASSPMSSGGSGGHAAGAGGAAGSGGSGGSAGSSGDAGSGGASSGGAGGTNASGGSAGTTDAAAETGGEADTQADATPGGLGSLEAIEVPAAGTAVTTQTKLDAGELFLLRASGAVDLGATKLDAEFSASGDVGTDMAGAADVGVDTGTKALILLGEGRAAPAVSPNRQKWFGAYRADHVYYMIVTGAGQPLSLKLVKPAGAAAGSGAITVAIYRLTPTAMGLGAPLENPPFMVPFTKTRESNTFKSVVGSVYLLQAAGEAQVGGKGANGDAEFDDYKADGTGSNEGEGGADFGVGIDEACSAKRARKWGAFRKDHDYYMLYAGTGMPINFSYCDTGYGDNAGGMAIKIFATP